LGVFDVLVGVNLLREGLDLPEVSLVAVIDADKEGFLRSNRSLTQTAGRAARNVNGKVIFYADTITRSMRTTMEETERRRKIQADYNKAHDITPQALKKSREDIIKNTSMSGLIKSGGLSEPESAQVQDPVISYMNPHQLKKAIEKTRKDMTKAATEMDFMEAARLRDELQMLEQQANLQK